jgi:hypothetical protein
MKRWSRGELRGKLERMRRLQQVGLRRSAQHGHIMENQENMKKGFWENKTEY